MYAQSKVQSRLELAQREFSITPEYHAVSEVVAFEDHLTKHNMYTYDDFGKPSGTQNLTDFERAWMLNEQVLVLCDAAYFLTRYAFLRDEEGVIQRFNFRVPQRIYFDIICDLEEREAAIEIQVLKARQLGMSIFTELLISHRVIFSYGVSSVIGSADQTKTSEMSKMLLLCYDMLPVWLRPQHTSRVESERGKLLFGHMASGVSFQHGSQKFGIATGSTPTIYHLSEVALYGDSAMMLIDEGLWKAVHASPSVFGVLESTGRGNKGWWAETWYYSKSRWPRSRMFPMFLPWYCGTDIYPKPTWLRTRPIPSDWRPNHDTRLHVAKSELYVKSSPLLERHLLEEQSRRGIDVLTQWRMPREQQWYWEVNHEEAKAKGNESSFLQEMAGDDEEALQRSIESVFGHATIEMIEERRKPTYDRFTISGQSIEDSHEVSPEYFDYTRERIPVSYQSSKQISKWELIPLKSVEVREDDPADVDSVLLIWEHPQPRINYSIGVDTSTGAGEDSTCISVWALGYGNLPDVQVAEFTSAYVSHVEAFAFVMAISAYYAKHMREGQTKWKEPYVSVEQVEAVGDTCQHQMGLLGYHNFHHMPRYDASPKKIRRQKRASSKTGWYTWGWSRPILTGSFVHWSKNGWARINSPWLVDEMKSFEVHYTARGKERLEHEDDKHDDRIFAAAMAIFCPHDMESMTHRSKKRIESPTALPPIDLGPYRGNTFSPADMSMKQIATIDEILYSDARLERYR